MLQRDEVADPFPRRPRIVRVDLSSGFGRESVSETAQAHRPRTGAHSIFTSDKLLTAANAGDDSDAALFAKLGLRALAAEQRLMEAAE